MNRLLKLLRSDLFLSLAGGFALGVAGLAVIKPASAGHHDDMAKAVTVETPQQGVNSSLKAS
jgi:hypothetical protein